MFLKDWFNQLFERLKGLFSKTQSSQSLSDSLNSAKKSSSLQTHTPKTRPPFERFYIYVFVLFLSLLTADLLILSFRDRMIPMGGLPTRPLMDQMSTRPDRFAYENIIQRNIFNSDGIIPPPKGQSTDAPVEQDVAVETQLPITLVGTIVHANPGRSIATLELKNQNKILPFIVNDDMEGLGVVKKIERKRLIFRNSNNNRLEYVEIKDQGPVVFETNRKTPTNTDIEKRGDTVVMRKNELEKHLSNLPEILQQARAVPYPPGGPLQGFQLVDIQPGSIYEKLGFQRGDVIQEVNGQKLDSAARGLELYNQLKGGNGPVSISGLRNGSKHTWSFAVE